MPSLIIHWCIVNETTYLSVYARNKRKKRYKTEGNGDWYSEHQVLENRTFSNQNGTPVQFWKVRAQKLKEHELIFKINSMHF